MPHHCHALGCKASVPPRLFMCAKHWYALPKLHRDTIWRLYRPGQEIDKNPTDAYCAVANEAKLVLFNAEHGADARSIGEALRWLRDNGISDE